MSFDYFLRYFKENFVLKDLFNDKEEKVRYKLNNTIEWYEVFTTSEIM